MFEEIFTNAYGVSQENYTASDKSKDWQEAARESLSGHDGTPLDLENATS